MTWIFEASGAFRLDPGSADSALLLQLGAGSYTTHVTTDDPTRRGEALLEIFLLPYE